LEKLGCTEEKAGDAGPGVEGLYTGIHTYACLSVPIGEHEMMEILIEKKRIV
jgi:hypothetical protein